MFRRQRTYNRRIARSNHVHVWTSSFSSVETPLLYTSCQLTLPLRQRCHLSPSFSLSVRNSDCKLIMTKFNFQPLTTRGFPADAIFLYRNSNGQINCVELLSLVDFHISLFFTRSSKLFYATIFSCRFQDHINTTNKICEVGNNFGDQVNISTVQRFTSSSRIWSTDQSVILCIG